MPFIDLAKAAAEMIGALPAMLWAMALALSFTDWLQILGAFTGILGAYLLARNNQASRYGYVVYVVSNFMWAAYGLMVGAYGLVVMQSVFFVTTLIGLKNWFPLRWNRIRMSSRRTRKARCRPVPCDRQTAANDDVALLDLVSRGRRVGSL